ncbi:MAG: tRNA nucleotidyltransferase, partial [Muribaculaceae bacterium]|nr:tRNA nucleotidyltransferase [Muribaculaceae bacterium]
MNVPAKDEPILRRVGSVADSLGLDAYAVGGDVCACLRGRASEDIDFVTVGSGIELARAVAAGRGTGAH